MWEILIFKVISAAENSNDFKTFFNIWQCKNEPVRLAIVCQLKNKIIWGYRSLVGHWE